MVLPVSAHRRQRLAAVLTIAAAACSGAPSAPSPAATISIGAAGVAPREVKIKAWQYVTFVNNDVRPHTIVSDPVDAHTLCPPVNRVGILQPGESRETGTLDLKRVCRYHDHTDPSNISMMGQIVVD